MAIRKQVIKSMHFRHGPPLEEKVFIRCTGEKRLRDLDDFDRARSRDAIERKYGELTRTWMHPRILSLHHFTQCFRLLGSKIRPGPRDAQGNAEYDFELWTLVSNAPTRAPQKDDMYNFGPGRT